MRYIRTKDGIYELVDNLYEYHKGIEKYWYAIEENGKRYAIEITSNEILKQSETIEELCDRFVVIDKETKEVMNIVAFWEYAKIWVSWKYNIYGAIWTDKGLIYVAKMNENGELELI